MTGEKSDALVLFGATGDLAHKKIFPSLYAMAVDGLLDVPVIGVASSDGDDEFLREKVRASLAEQVTDAKEDVVEQLLEHVRYVSGDYREPAVFDELAKVLEPVWNRNFISSSELANRNTSRFSTDSLPR